MLAQQNQFFGLVDGQFAQQYLIEDGKNGRICPNAEGQRHHRDGRESGILAQLPRCVTDVLE
jgi:hypothetical protein